MLTDRDDERGGREYSKGLKGPRRKYKQEQEKEKKKEKDEKQYVTAGAKQDAG